MDLPTLHSVRLEEAMPFYIHLLRRGTFFQIYSFTLCNKGCLFFHVVLVTAFNHACPLSPLTLPSGNALRNPECFPPLVPVERSKPQGFGQRVASLWPHVLTTVKAPSRSHFLAFAIHFQHCLGPTIFFIMWIIINLFISSWWACIV